MHRRSFAGLAPSTRLPTHHLRTRLYGDQPLFRDGLGVSLDRYRRRGPVTARLWTNPKPRAYFERGFSAEVSFPHSQRNMRSVRPSFGLV